MARILLLIGVLESTPFYQQAWLSSRSFPCSLDRRARHLPGHSARFTSMSSWRRGNPWRGWQKLSPSGQVLTPIISDLVLQRPQDFGPCYRGCTARTPYHSTVHFVIHLAKCTWWCQSRVFSTRRTWCSTQWRKPPKTHLDGNTHDSSRPGNAAKNPRRLQSEQARHNALCVTLESTIQDLGLPETVAKELNCRCRHSSKLLWQHLLDDASPRSLGAIAS